MLISGSNKFSNTKPDIIYNYGIMAELLLGISTGFIMYAYVNRKYNKVQWIDSKYPLGMGVLILMAGLFLLPT